MKSRLGIEILTWESEREVETAEAAGILIRYAVPEGFCLVPQPYRLSCSVRYKPRRVEMIDVTVYGFLFLSAAALSSATMLGEPLAWAQSSAVRPSIVFRDTSAW